MLTLTGADVRALLTETITATLPASAHAGKFPYGGHLRYTFTETTPGKRGTLTQLQWQDADGQWQDLVDATRYRVVMNAYSANGNDGWQALARAQAQHAERQDLAWQDGKLTAFRSSGWSRAAISSAPATPPAISLTARQAAWIAAPTPPPSCSMCANSALP